MTVEIPKKHNFVKNMKNKDIETTDDSISIHFKTTSRGIVLNNLNIAYNSDTDDTSLRYDILSDIDNDENAYKVGDKYSKKQLKDSFISKMKKVVPGTNVCVAERGLEVELMKKGECPF